MYLPEDETLYGNYQTLVALRNTHEVGKQYMAAREIDAAINRYETYSGSGMVWFLTTVGLAVALGLLFL